MIFEERYVKWLVNEAKTKYKDDIALIVLYGSYQTKTHEEGSDVDVFFVPKSDAGWSFSKTFIYNNVGYDIFGMSWDRLDRISELEEDILPLLGHSTIIYADSDENRLKFYDLRKKMILNLNNDEKINKVIDIKLENALNHLIEYKKNTRELLYLYQIILDLSHVVLFGHHSYLKKGLKDLMFVLDELGEIAFKQRILQIIYNKENRFEKTQLLVKDYFAKYNKEIDCQKEPNIEKFDCVRLKNVGAWFEEFTSNFRKAERAENSNNPWQMFLTLAAMQKEFQCVKDIFRPFKLDIFHEFNPDNLSTHLNEVLTLERGMKHILNEKKVKLNIVDDSFLNE